MCLLGSSHYVQIEAKLISGVKGQNRGELWEDIATCGELSRGFLASSTSLLHNLGIDELKDAFCENSSSLIICVLFCHIPFIFYLLKKFLFFGHTTQHVGS